MANEHADRIGSPQVITFGCRLNALDSDSARAAAVEAGRGADTIIINTCAVTAEAVRQARQAIRKARRERPEARIVVTGCAAQIDPESFASMPEVDRVLGNAEKASAPAYARLFEAPEKVQVSDVFAVRQIAPHLAGAAQSRTRAFVQVQTGCDHRCTFCVIPYGRGNARSAPAGDVVQEVRRLAQAGAPEVVLTGVDLTSWGGDLPGRPALGDLVQRILKLVPELPRLRLSSVDAVELDPVLFRLVTEHPRVAPYLHLSLQHGHDLILKRMKRRHLREDSIRLAAQLKAARPDIALGADLIAGFPTEEEDHFAASCSLIEQAHLSFVHVFPYSPRPQTPAAKMPQLSRAVIKERAERLRGVARGALQRHLAAWVGREVEALVEQPGSARLADFTPVRMTGGEPGAIRRLRILGHDGEALLA